MKKKYALLFCIMSGLTASATPLTMQEALQRLRAVSSVRKVVPAGKMQAMECVATLPQLYVFSSGEGFAVCPADDAAPALLGYSDRGTFDLDANPSLAYWLDCYSREIEAAASAAHAPAARPQRKAIAPMVTTRWNQTWPYNEQCPEVNGNHCPTGCLATAVAQVLRYHQWPAKGTGSYSYAWNGQTLTFDYGKTEFDWDNMADTYSASSPQKEIDAVATLMYACGVGTNMSYSAASSGASDVAIPRMLTENFDYGRDIIRADRKYYSLLEWEQLIYDDLSHGLPVIYGAITPSGGGHEFVCDGYEGDGFFHINWGWSGMSDGYFLLSILHPTVQGTGGSTGGYNKEQYAILNVHPSWGNEEPVYSIGFENGIRPEYAESYGVGKPLMFAGRIINTGALPLPAGSTVGIRLHNLEYADDSYDDVVENWNQNPLPANRGLWNIGYASFPDYIIPGTYLIKGQYTLPGEKTPHDVQVAHGTAGELYMTLSKDGTITFDKSNAGESKPAVYNITLTTPYFIGRNLIFDFTLANESDDTDFRGNVTPILIDEQTGKEAARGGYIFASLSPGEAKDYTFSGAMTADKGTLAPGAYRLAMVDDRGNILGETYSLEAYDGSEDTKVTYTTFALDTDDPKSDVAPDKSAVGFRVGVACDNGYFYQTLRIVVYPSGGGSLVKAINTPTFNIPAGQKEELTVITDMSDVADGTYIAFLNAANYSNPNFTFTLKAKGKDNEEGSDTSIDEMEIGNHHDVIFDLQGRRVACAKRGLYIINGKIINVN